jgi:hypothetical protein
MGRRNPEDRDRDSERERDELQDAVDTTLDYLRAGDLKRAVKELESVESEEDDTESRD